MTEKKLRGFALMTPTRLREVAAKGGVIAHQRGTPHLWTKEEARAAAMKSVALRKAKVES